MISIIVAIAADYAIGRQGSLLCHLPDDLKHFKAITSTHPVLMGERTFLSLPTRPLPHRRNIVLTDQEEKTFEGAEAVYSLDEALALLRQADDECFIIGGGMVYRQFMALADKLYITHIHHTFDEADTFFPSIEPSVWHCISQEHHDSDEKNPYPYTFAEYIRK